MCYDAFWQFFSLFSTVIDENGENVRLVPIPIPVPTPIYIPVPMHLYTQYTPLPLGFPLPVCILNPYADIPKLLYSDVSTMLCS